MIKALTAAGVPIFEYGAGLNTEQAIFSAASDGLVQELLDYARKERGDDGVDNNLDLKIPDLELGTIRGDFAVWELVSAWDGSQLREAIAEVAGRKKWFKDQRIGRNLSSIVWRIASVNSTSPLARTLAEAEAWLYA